MYDDRAGFWETFSPLYFFRKRDDSKCQISVRVTTFVLVISVCAYTYYHPEVIEAIQELSIGGVSELVAWGEDKILSVFFIQNSTQVSGIPSYSKYDEILNEKDEVDIAGILEEEIE